MSDGQTSRGEGAKGPDGALHHLKLTVTTVCLSEHGEPSLRSIVVEESVDESLVERFMLCPSSWSPCGPACVERRLASVTLHKKNGSLGVMIAEGTDHGLYIQAVSPDGPAHQQGSLKPGDRVVGINGRSVENLPYSVAVDLLRQIPEKVTLLVSQPVISAPPDSTTVAPDAAAPPQPSTHSIESEATRVDRPSLCHSTLTANQTRKLTTSPRPDSTVSRSDLPCIHPGSGFNLPSHQESATRSDLHSRVDSAHEACTVSRTDSSSRASLTRSDSTYRAEVLQTDSTPASDSTPTESLTPRAGSPTVSQESLPPTTPDKGRQAQVRAVGGVTFAKEVRSGPITVITLNTTPSSTQSSNSPSPLTSPATTVPSLACSVTATPSSAPAAIPSSIVAAPPSLSRTLDSMTKTASHQHSSKLPPPSPVLQQASTTSATNTSLQKTEASSSTVISTQLSEH